MNTWIEINRNNLSGINLDWVIGKDVEVQIYGGGKWKNTQWDTMEMVIRCLEDKTYRYRKIEKGYSHKEIMTGFWNTVELEYHKPTGYCTKSKMYLLYDVWYEKNWFTGKTRYEIPPEEL